MSMGMAFFAVSSTAMGPSPTCGSMQSLEPSLDLASRDAFVQWIFRPARRGAEPVPIAITVETIFTMRP